MFVFFCCFSFLCRNNVTATFFFPLNYLNIMRYVLKTCSTRWTILMLLPTEGIQLCVFILGATPQICETAQYEPATSKENCNKVNRELYIFWQYPTHLKYRDWVKPRISSRKLLSERNLKLAPPAYTTTRR